MHTLDKVKREFMRFGIKQGKAAATLADGPLPHGDDLPAAPPPDSLETPRVSRKRPPQASPQKSKRPRGGDGGLREAPRESEDDAREMGSNGEQCDWCGLTPGEGEAALRVCRRCHYSCCAECSPHPTKGTCHCRDSNFGTPYPRGAARKRHMTGSW